MAGWEETLDVATWTGKFCSQDAFGGGLPISATRLITNVSTASSPGDRSSPASLMSKRKKKKKEYSQPTTPHPQQGSLLCVTRVCAIHDVFNVLCMYALAHVAFITPSVECRPVWRVIQAEKKKPLKRASSVSTTVEQVVSNNPLDQGPESLRWQQPYCAPIPHSERMTRGAKIISVSFTRMHNSDPI